MPWGGETLHTAGYLDIGNRPRLSHTDVDVLFTKNRQLKWVIVDEIGMISDLLLGAFETALSDASDREARYKSVPKIFTECSAGTTCSPSVTSAS